MRIFDWLFGKNSKNLEVKCVGKEKGKWDKKKDISEAGNINKKKKVKPSVKKSLKKKPLERSTVKTNVTNEWIKLLLKKMKITESDILRSDEMDHSEVREMFGEHGCYMLDGIASMNVNQPDRAFCCLAKYIQLSEDGPPHRDAIRLFLIALEQILNRYEKEIPELNRLPPEIKRLRGTEFELLTK